MRSIDEIKKSLLAIQELSDFLLGYRNEPKSGVEEARMIVGLSAGASELEIREVFKVLQSNPVKVAFQEKFQKEGYSPAQLDWNKRWRIAMESLTGTMPYLIDAAPKSTSTASPTTPYSSNGDTYAGSESTVESPQSQGTGKSFSSSPASPTVVSQQQNDLPQYASIKTVDELRALLRWVNYHVNTADKHYAAARDRYVGQLKTVDLSDKKGFKLTRDDIKQLKAIGRDFPEKSRLKKHKILASPAQNNVAKVTESPPLTAQIRVEKLKEIVESYKSSALIFWKSPGPELAALKKLVADKEGKSELCATLDEVKAAIMSVAKKSGYKASRVEILSTPSTLDSKKDSTGVSQVVKEIGEQLLLDIRDNKSRRDHGGPITN